MQSKKRVSQEQVRARINLKIIISPKFGMERFIKITILWTQAATDAPLAKSLIQAALTVLPSLYSSQSLFLHKNRASLNKKMSTWISERTKLANEEEQPPYPNLWMLPASWPDFSSSTYNFENQYQVIYFELEFKLF